MIKVTMKNRWNVPECVEAHINDAIRKIFSVKKVASSHRKGITELLIQDPVDTQLLETCCGRMRVQGVGYSLEPYEKQGFSLFKRK